MEKVEILFCLLIFVKQALENKTYHIKVYVCGEIIPVAESTMTRLRKSIFLPG